MSDNVWDLNEIEDKAALEYQICRKDLAAFVEKTFKTITPGVSFCPNWHLDCMAEYLMACYRREIKRLIINVPPRSLKSVSCTVAFPAWVLGQDPSNKIISSSYSKHLSIKHSVDCRFMMESEWYKKCFPNTRIADDDNQKSKYVTTARGHRMATSTGAATTGEGGNFLIVDDPHNAMEAQSKVIRTSQIEWFDQSFSTRLNDKKEDVIIVIMQRLHEADLTGHLLKMGTWEHLCIPAMFTQAKTFTIGNFSRSVKAGEILHEDREDATTLANMKLQMGSYGFAGQYMQTPVPDGGGIIKREWIKLYPNNMPLPTFECIIQSYDTALTKGTFSDPTAFTAWGIFQFKNKYCALLLDAWDEKLEYPELRKKALREWHTRYGSGDGKRADYVLIEGKASGKSLIQDLSRAQVPTREYNPGNADKVQRAHLVSYLFEQGCIFVPEHDRIKNKTYDWVEGVLAQLNSFPNAEHDDYVDSTTQAIRLLRDMSWLTVAEDPEEEDIIENEILINPYGA